MKEIIISLGGSIIVPREIDIGFLRKFRKIILENTHQGKKFVIISGGGKICRLYQKAAKEIDLPRKDDLDWLGIYSSRLNAYLLRTIFYKEAHPKIITNPSRQKKIFKEKIVIAAGWRPGWSTDYVATRLAQNYGIKILVNLFDQDYVYDRDPRKFKKTKALKVISWHDFRKIVGDKWDPGLNLPFDPVASRLAERLGLKVLMLNGRRLDNFQNFLLGRPFNGTEIK